MADKKIETIEVDFSVKEILMIGEAIAVENKIREESVSYLRNADIKDEQDAIRAIGHMMLNEFTIEALEAVIAEKKASGELEAIGEEALDS